MLKPEAPDVTLRLVGITAVLLSLSKARYFMQALAISLATASATCLARAVSLASLSWLKSWLVWWASWGVGDATC